MFMIAEGCHPQTIAVVRTRAEARAYRPSSRSRGFEFARCDRGAAAVSTTDGKIEDYRAFCDRAHAAGALVTVGDRPARTHPVTPPGNGADIAVGNSQRFRRADGLRRPARGVLRHARSAPAPRAGRIIGVSRDAAGRPALRMALQTREQHIRREKATSNICTAQVLLAVMAA